MTEYDYVVVGGRVAGASTAMMLARAGASVLLLERTAYGSDTLSTHGLMRAGVLQLSRWGLLDSIAAAGTPAVRRTVFRYTDDDEVHVSIRPSPGVPALYAPRRWLLDRVLVDAAAAAGADVRHGVTVTGLLTDRQGRVRGVQAADGSRRPFEAHSRVTVGADGIRSTVAASVAAPTRRNGRSGGAALYGYYDDLPSTGYEWAYGPGAAAGLIPTNDGLTCVFVGTTPLRMKEARRQGAEAAFDRLFARAAPGQVPRLASARRVGRLHGWSGAAGFVRRSSGPGWALVGDAGYFRDPISTHGITDALRDAELLADGLLASTAGVPERLALAGYEAQRDALSRRLFDVSDEIAAYDWDTPRIQQLLREMSSAMSDEVELLQALPECRIGATCADGVWADTPAARG